MTRSVLLDAHEEMSAMYEVISRARRVWSIHSWETPRAKIDCMRLLGQALSDLDALRAAQVSSATGGSDGK